MYPGHHAAVRPDARALVMGRSGATVTYRQLDERSNRLAHLLRAAGLRPDDGLAVLLDNNPRYHEVTWAGLRAGLHVTPVNRYLTPEEAAYVVNDSGARAVVTSAALAPLAAALPPLLQRADVRLVVDGPLEGWAPYEEETARFPATPLDDEPLGQTMLYSSGTTGRPKGIRRPLSGRRASEGSERNGHWARLYGFGPDTVFLSPAPMYHASPLHVSLAVQAAGGTVVMMERFDPLEALRCIDEHGVTHSQWVPTMFTRLLKLSEEERGRYDTSRQRVVMHGAAPCPVEVKRRMIEWWGPVLMERYSSSEGIGMTSITSEEWLQRPGSVGRAERGVVHVCDDTGRELAPGEVGTVYFELPGAGFAYHGDAAKSRDVEHPRHPDWRTVGDVGYVDADGYLFLTDRKAFVIVSGGVNVYPQEVEHALVLHPEVADVAVFGVPDDDFGEQVKAVVEPARWERAGPELEAELAAWCRQCLAGYKRPRSFDFVSHLPRLPTGKLAKGELRDRYWRGRTTRVL